MQATSPETTHPHNPAQVLVVSDDPEIGRLWAYALEQIGLGVSISELGAKAIERWAEALPDLVVVDSHCWQGEDIEFCRLLRVETVVPILLFTAQNDEYYLLDAYRSGVDEVVAQPVSPRLFLAKVRAWLRRAQSIPSSVLDDLAVGGFTLDEGRRLISLPNGRMVRLTHLEARLLYLMMGHPNQVLESTALIERVWGHYGEGDGALLKNLVYRLRCKIEPDPAAPRHLITEGNLGYRFRSG
jgi:DNA-binding response OmpR family regulator